MVAVDLRPGATQGELISAVEPVADRLLKRYRASQEAFKTATEQSNAAAAEAAKNELDALLLFKSDMGAFIRLYTFLSQIFDYGNTAIEKRAIFYKRLSPLLEFGREREGVDLSKIVLTHHNLKNRGKQAMPLTDGEAPKLDPITEAGSGGLNDPQKALLNEIIQKVNSLFEGELSDQDKLIYVNHVIAGKMLESKTLVQQAKNNTNEQFNGSPDIRYELMEAAIATHDAHEAMSKQLLNSPDVRDAVLSFLLKEGRLWERLREQQL